MIALGLPHSLIEQLVPYLGAKRQEARKLLRDKPLRITLGDALLIDKAFKQKFVKQLAADYGASLHNRRKAAFFDLPAEAQTVIASVAFQYGDLPDAAPRFWKAVCAQEWRNAIAELRNFGDRYDTRRRLEANLLDAIANTPVEEVAL